MKRLLSILLGCGLIALLVALGSCANHKQHGPPPPEAEQISQADSTGRPPAGIVIQPAPSLLDKLTGRTPPAEYYPPGTPVRAGKKSTITINNVKGSQHNQTNMAGKNATAGTGATGGGKADGPVAGTGGTLTNIEKAKAPTNTGTGGTVTDNTKQGQRGGAAASGDGATATATTIKPPTPWLKYGLWALGIVGGYWLLFGGGGVLLLAWLRRKSSTENQA